MLSYLKNIKSAKLVLQKKYNALQNINKNYLKKQLPNISYPNHIQTNQNKFNSSYDSQMMDYLILTYQDEK